MSTINDENTKGNKPVKPNFDAGQKSVKPTLNNGQKPVRPNFNTEQKPVRPSATSGQSGQKPVKPMLNNDVQKKVDNKQNGVGQKPVKPGDTTNKKLKKDKTANVVNNNEEKTGNVNNGKKVNIKKIGIIAGAVVVVIVAGVLILKFGRSDGKHLTLADKPTTEQVNDVVDTDKVENTENTEAKEPVANKKDKKAEAEEVVDTRLKVGESAKIDMIVNTKLEGDSEFKDYETYADVSITELVCGYDEVMEVVNTYNETSKSKINIPEKDIFYTNSQGNELVLIKTVIKYPEDFPTNDKYSRIYTSPDLNLSIVGTQADTDEPDKIATDKIITDKYKYSIPSITKLNTDTSEIVGGQEIEYKFITWLPQESSSDMYSFILTYSDSSISESTAEFGGFSIPKIAYDGVEINVITNENKDTTAEGEEDTSEDSKEDNSIDDKDKEESTEESTDKTDDSKYISLDDE